MSQIALKEWAVAVRAMEAGLQNVVFRKGGIQEPEGDFQLQHKRFLLYPAREHQKAAQLKPQFLPLLQSTIERMHGHQVEVRSQAQVRATHLITSLEEAERFDAQHIWNKEFIRMRLEYKPDRPLYVIELDVLLLDKPIIFTESTLQAGCKSWVDVETSEAATLEFP